MNRKFTVSQVIKKARICIENNYLNQIKTLFLSGF